MTGLLRGANRARGCVPLLGPWWPRLREGVDDADALEVVESRQVFGVQSVDTSFGTRRDNQGVPQRRPSREMELPGARQVAIRWQLKRQEIPELGETVPSVGRGESLFVSLREAERNSQATCHRRTPSCAVVMRSRAIF